MLVEAKIVREGNAEHVNVVGRCDSVWVDLYGRPLLPSDGWLYFEPAHSSYVLSAFSLRRFADIQWLTSSRHRSSRTTVAAISSRKQCRQSWVSSANAWMLTSNFLTTSARSVLHKMNRRGPRTDPCGPDNVKHGRRGTTIDDMERSALQVWAKPLECNTVNTKLSLKTEHQQVMVDSVKSRR